jgi:hypothetical protein
MILKPKQPAPPPETIALSIVPCRAWAAKGSLTDLNPGLALKKTTATLEAMDLVHWAILGLDISLNDLTKVGGEEIWQAHVYGFVETSNRRKLRTELKKAFPIARHVSKPVRTKKYDGSGYGASYALKPWFVRRVSYRGANGKPRTRKVRLKPPEHIEVMLAMDKLGLHRRLSAIGLHPEMVGGQTRLEWDL